MALEIATTTESGLELDSAYVKITTALIFNGETEPSTIVLTVCTFANQDARLQGFKPLLIETYPVDDEDYETYFGISVLDQQDVNPIKQAYEYLKTFPQFENGKDV